MVKKVSRSAALLGLVAFALIIATPPVQAQNLTTYRVEITNTTYSQIFSPPIVVSHGRNVALFRAGEPASPELALLAEDGDASPLADVLAGTEGVFDVNIADGPVLPGASVVLEIEARFPFSRISVAGMLIQTNDAFFAVNGADLPARRMRGVHNANAYDAGSEENNELCAFIPGPPCGSGGVRATADAEGFVHLHRGFHGIGDLDADRYDWRNPTARVTIQRVP